MWGGLPGQGRRQEKQTKANAGAQRGRRDHPGSQFLSVCSGPGGGMHAGHTACAYQETCWRRGFRRGDEFGQRSKEAQKHSICRCLQSTKQ